MSKLKFARGYSRYFLGKENKVELPILSEDLQSQVARRSEGGDEVLRYKHYSVVLHKERRLPIFSAANINGQKFKKIARTEIFENGRDHWRKDKRVGYNKQWGKELYISDMSNFDIGHLTKREDVQWGRTYGDAKEHAKYTFYFTNAVPQHAKVNQGIWRQIEDYILHSEVTSHQMKVSVFTGTVLSENDPVFVTEVRGEEIQLPVLFWKVVYYLNDRDELCRLAFLVGQKELLEEEGIVYRSRGVDDAFSDFKKGDTFQVNVSLIEELVGCTFTPAKDVYVDERPVELVLEAVQSRGVNENEEQQLKGLIL